MAVALRRSHFSRLGASLGLGCTGDGMCPVAEAPGRDVTAKSEGVGRQFFADSTAALKGENDNPYRMMSDDVEFIVTGQTPLSGTWRGMRAVMEDFLVAASPLMGRGRGHGLFPVDFISEGHRVAVLARGRGSNALGVPYNNTYFLWF